MLGTAHRGKRWSGEFKRDFGLLSKNKACPADLLAAVLRHVGYVPDDQERADALDCLERMRGFNGSVNILLSCFEKLPSLRSFAQAVDRDFRIIDRYTEAWRMIYGLHAPPRDGQGRSLHAAGVTEKPTPVLLERLGSERAGRANTRMGEFLQHVREEGRECYLLELECCFGDLEEAATVKNLWLVAALRSGGATLKMPWIVLHPEGRVWPSCAHLDEIAAGKLASYDWRTSVMEGSLPQKTYTSEKLDEAIWMKKVLQELQRPAINPPARVHQG